MRFLRAFIWLRWRLLVNGLRGGKRRDAMEDFSRAAGIAIPILFFVFFGIGAITFSWISFQGGRLVASGEAPPATVLFPARLMLLMLLFVFALVPLVRSMQGGTVGVARFVLLPIPRSALHVVEVAGSLADPWSVAAAPALLLFGAGMAIEGAIVPAAFALAAAIVFLILVASLAALLSFLTSWLFLDRRRAELATLIFMIALMTSGFLPAFFASRVANDGGEMPRANGRMQSVAAFDAALPAWTAVLPSEICAAIVGAAVEGERARAAMGLVWLAAEAAALFALSSALHARLLGSVASEGRRKKNSRGDVREFRFPLLTVSASAVAVAQVRASLRTLMGRMAILGVGPMILVIGMLMHRVTGDGGGEIASVSGHLLAAAGMVFSLLTLQPILMNQLASDRAGLTLQFLSPISDRDLVIGKAVGGFFLFLPCALLGVGAALIVDRSAPPLAWLAAILAGIATYLWTAPVSAILSAIFPKASNLGALGTAAKAHGAAQFFGSVATLVAAAPPALTLVFGTRAHDGSSTTITLIVIWTLLAAVAVSPLLGAAARLLPSRRENIALVASGR